MAFYDRLLKDDEILVAIVRQTPICHIWRLFYGLFFLGMSFFLSVYLFRWGMIGLALFSLMFLIGFVTLVRVVMVYYFNSFIITDKRIIDWDQRGIFHKEISEVDYLKVQDITYKIKGFWATVLNFGTLQIQTASGSLALELSYVKKPANIQSLLIDIKRNYEQSKG